MTDHWNTHWLNRSEMFAPLRAVGALLPDADWPDTDRLNRLAVATRLINAQGIPVRFVAQNSKSKEFHEQFEPRAFLRGEVQVRPHDWHDMFNALAWMTFPATKATINARHYESLSCGVAGARPPARDALTLFDEDGVVVLSSDSSLLDLVRAFGWKELFWTRREEVRNRMHFFLFGHALYHKATRPFVGMTGKAILLNVPDAFLHWPLSSRITHADHLLAAWIRERARLSRGRDLSPLPVLGVPGWWRENEQEMFYANADYFRPGRAGAVGQAARLSE